MSDLISFLNKTGIKIEKEFEDGVLVRCLNPSHVDNNPSMKVWNEKPFGFHCLGCGLKGSLIGSSKEFFGKHYSKIMGKEFVKKNEFTVNSIRKKQTKKKTNQGTKTIKFEGKIYTNPFEIQEAKEYMNRRGMSKDFCDYFGVFAVNECEVIIETHKKTIWYKRIVIPIKNENNEVISYEARSFAENPKVKVLYPKGVDVNSTLFNFNNIDKDKNVFKVEGIMGLCSVWEYDRNVVATFGKNLSNMQKKLLIKLKHLTSIPDNDWNKGRDNLVDDIKLLNSFYPYDYRVALILEDGEDPNDVSDMQELLSDTILASEYLFELENKNRFKNLPKSLII